MSLTTAGEFIETTPNGKLLVAEFNGNASGNSDVTVTGLEVGDIVLSIINTTDNDEPLASSAFRYIVRSADTLRQFANSLNTKDLVAVILRPAS